MALQEIFGGVWMWRFGRIVDDLTILTFGWHQLTSSFDRIAILVRAPRTGTIESVEFLTWKDGFTGSTIAVDWMISLQDILAPAAARISQPNQVPAQYRILLASAFVDNTWTSSGILSSNGTDTGVKRTVQQGDEFAVVFEIYNPTPDIAIVGKRMAFALAIGGRNSKNGELWVHELIRKSNSGTLGPYSESVQSAPSRPVNLAIKYTDGVYMVPVSGGYAISDLTAFSATPNNTPDEYALRFMIPCDASLAGVLYFCGSGDIRYDVTLYDGNTNVMYQREGLPIGGTVFSHPLLTIFTAEQFIAKNTVYRLAVKKHQTPQWLITGGATIQTFGVPNPSIMAANACGAEWYLSTRKGSGPWTDNPLRRPFIAPGFSALSDGL